MTAGRLNPEEPFTVPIISNPVFSQESGVKPMIWFIAGALRHAWPESLTVQQIRASIEVHQPWRIAACRGPDKSTAAESNIRWILSKSPAFAPDARFPGHWGMTGEPLVRTPKKPLSLPLYSTRMMTETEKQAYREWLDRLFAPFRGVPDVTTINRSQ